MFDRGGRVPVNSRKRVQRRLLPGEVAELLRSYAAGATMADLADQFGVHRKTVASQLTHAGVEPRRKGLLETEVDEASRLYLEGWSLQRLADRFGVTATTVHLRLRALGVPMRRPWERG